MSRRGRASYSMHGIEQFPEICDVSLPATSFPLYIRRILMCTRERRLEEQIRELCARVVAEQEPDELKRAITERSNLLRLLLRCRQWCKAGGLEGAACRARAA